MSHVIKGTIISEYSDGAIRTQVAEYDAAGNCVHQTDETVAASVLVPPAAPPEQITEPEHPKSELKGKLPEDFPGHAALLEAGIHTYAQLRKAGELTEIPGIGEATAAKIAEALEG